MRLRSIVLLFFVSTLTFSTAPVYAQNNSREFIESSSPLANGDRVTSRSEPGRDVQTVITVSAESIARRSEESSRDRIDLTARRAPQTGADGAPVVGTQSSIGRYPYPAANQRAIANYPQSTVQLPTLGIGNVRTARRAQLFQIAIAIRRPLEPIGSLHQRHRFQHFKHHR